VPLSQVLFNSFDVVIFAIMLDMKYMLRLAFRLLMVCFLQVHAQQIEFVDAFSQLHFPCLAVVVLQALLRMMPNASNQ